MRLVGEGGGVSHHPGCKREKEQSWGWTSGLWGLEERLHRHVILHVAFKRCPQEPGASSGGLALIVHPGIDSQGSMATECKTLTLRERKLHPC